MALSFPVILVISPDMNKISVIKKGLKSLFHVLTVPDGGSALRYLKEMLVDSILLDDQIKDMSSLELAKGIRNLSGYKETPLLLITNSLKRDFILEALSCGINDFLLSPLEADEIYQRLAVAFRSKPLERKTALVVEKLRKPPQKPSKEKTFESKLILDDQAIKEIAKAKKSGDILSLLWIQVESSRIDVPALLREFLRSQDLLIPQGTKSYLIILPKTSERAAKAIAEEIQHVNKGLKVTPMAYKKFLQFDFKHLLQT